MVYTGTLFTLDDGVDTVTATASTFGTGTWANPLSLAHSICAFSRNDGTFALAFVVSDDMKIKLYCEDTITITWSNTDLRDVLGYTGGSTVLTASTWNEATYTPTHCWIPERQRMDQGEFYRRINETAIGNVATDGVYSGINATGSTIWYRDIQFQFELSTNILASKETSSSSTNYDSDRCLETFLIGALTSSVTSDESVSPKGFWFYNDVRDVIYDEGGEAILNTTEPWAENTQNIGVLFDKGSSPHVKCFCHLNDATSITHLSQQASLPASTQRFDTPIISFHTATAPLWTYVDWSA